MVLEKSFDSISHFLHFGSGVQNKLKKIWFFWKLCNTTTVINDQIIFLYVRVEDLRLAWPIYLTPIYAACEVSDKRDLWVGLCRISHFMDGPYLIGDDFNVITHDGECTGHSRWDRGSSVFSDMILDCGLENAAFSSSHYTWTNDQVIKCLHRVLINATAA